MTHKHILLVLAILLNNLCFGQAGETTVKIGTQEWTLKNLAVIRFRNGDTIWHTKTREEWLKAGENKIPAYCYYDNKIANNAKYGVLYNWYAAADPRGIAPKGFHVPTDAEWDILVQFLGKDSASQQMKSVNVWKYKGAEVYNHMPRGNNKNGFTALPGGSRASNGEFPKPDDEYNAAGMASNWWSTTQSNKGVCCALVRNIYYADNFSGGDLFFAKGNGCYIRCIKDK